MEKKKKGEIILFTVTCNLRGIKSSKVSVLTRLYKHTHTLMHTQDCMKHPLCTVTKMAKIFYRSDAIKVSHRERARERQTLSPALSQPDL